MNAPITQNETQRLRVLYQYEILDTKAEEAFDELTQLAADICGTPIALISLVDADRQWFKSKVGIDACETARGHSFCAHTILCTDGMIVPDATKDPRFATNPLVVGDPKIRFYAGVPLIAPGGMPMGSLCVIDREPRVLTPQQTRGLQTLAHQVVAQMDLRRALANVQRIEEEAADVMMNQTAMRV